MTLDKQTSDPRIKRESSTRLPPSPPTHVHAPRRVETWRSRLSDHALTRLSLRSQPMREAQQKKDGTGRGRGRGEGSSEIGRVLSSLVEGTRCNSAC